MVTIEIFINYLHPYYLLPASSLHLKPKLHFHLTIPILSENVTKLMRKYLSKLSKKLMHLTYMTSVIRRETKAYMSVNRNCKYTEKYQLLTLNPFPTSSITFSTGTGVLSNLTEQTVTNRNLCNNQRQIDNIKYLVNSLEVHLSA